MNMFKYCCFVKYNKNKKIIPKSDIFLNIEKYDGKIWGLKNHRYI